VRPILDFSRMFLAFSLAMIAGQLGADFLKMCGRAAWKNVRLWGWAVMMRVRTR
jgi:hypothetical protein